MDIENEVKVKNSKYGTSTLLGAMQVALAVLTAPVSRVWYNHWGAAKKERTQALPGDDTVPYPKLAYTRAISIKASPREIWPWLVQMGQARGGLYSYDGLENLAGCQIHSADRILPEFQSLSVGDRILFGPLEKSYPGQVVTDIQPERAIVMVGMDPVTKQPVPSATWAFVLEEQPDGPTRLLVRGRNGYEPTFANHLMWHIFEPVTFVMERKMLSGIKERVESE